MSGGTVDSPYLSKGMTGKNLTLTILLLLLLLLLFTGRPTRTVVQYIQQLSSSK